MGIGLGSDIDTGVGTSHTPKNIGVAFLSSQQGLNAWDEADVRCMSARRTSLFGGSDGN